MSVNRQPNGRWKARYRDAVGREHSRTFPRKLEAEEWERAQRDSIRRGDWINPTGSRILLYDYAESWRTVQHHRPETARKVESTLRVHVYPTFGHRRLGTLRTSEINEWIKALADGRAPNTVKGIYTVLASVCHAAVVDRLLPVSPCEGAKLPKIERPALRVLETAEMVAVADRMPAEYRAAVLVAAGTGLRIGELCGLTVDRIDFLRRTLRVDRQLATPEPSWKPPKSNAGYRTIPLAQGVIDIISGHLADHGRGRDGIVFHTRSGAAVHPASLSTYARPHLPEWATFHDLRHYYASLLIHQGCSVKLVQTLLGHESAAVTLNTYAGLWPSSEDDARVAVATVFDADKTRTFGDSRT